MLRPVKGWVLAMLAILAPKTALRVAARGSVPAPLRFAPLTAPPPEAHLEVSAPKECPVFRLTKGMSGGKDKAHRSHPEPHRVAQQFSYPLVLFFSNTHQRANKRP